MNKFRAVQKWNFPKLHAYLTFLERKNARKSKIEHCVRVPHAKIVKDNLCQESDKQANNNSSLQIISWDFPKKSKKAAHIQDLSTKNFEKVFVQFFIIFFYHKWDQRYYIGFPRCLADKFHSILKTKIVGTGGLLSTTHRPTKKLKKIFTIIKANPNNFLFICQQKWIRCFDKEATFNEELFNQRLFINCHVNSKLMKKQTVLLNLAKTSVFLPA